MKYDVFVVQEDNTASNISDSRPVDCREGAELMKEAFIEISQAESGMHAARHASSIFPSFSSTANSAHCENMYIIRQY